MVRNKNVVMKSGQKYSGIVFEHYANQNCGRRGDSVVSALDLGRED